MTQQIAQGCLSPRWAWLKLILISRSQEGRIVGPCWVFAPNHCEKRDGVVVCDHVDGEVSMGWEPEESKWSSKRNRSEGPRAGMKEKIAQSPTLWPKQLPNYSLPCVQLCHLQLISVGNYLFNLLDYVCTFYLPLLECVYCNSKDFGDLNAVSGTWNNVCTVATLKNTCWLNKFMNKYLNYVLLPGS